jgi:hypothetical protein
VSELCPNHSFKRTSTGVPVSAAYLKRWALQEQNTNASQSQLRVRVPGLRFLPLFVSENLCRIEPPALVPVGGVSSFGIGCTSLVTLSTLQVPQAKVGAGCPSFGGQRTVAQS